MGKHDLFYLSFHRAHRKASNDVVLEQKYHS
jgi:hypothetical protein